MARSNAKVTGIANEVMLSMRDILLDGLKRGVGAEQLGRELAKYVSLIVECFQCSDCLVGNFLSNFTWFHF